MMARRKWRSRLRKVRPCCNPPLRGNCTGFVLCAHRSGSSRSLRPHAGYIFHCTNHFLLRWSMYHKITKSVSLFQNLGLWTRVKQQAGDPGSVVHKEKQHLFFPTSPPPVPSRLQNVKCVQSLSRSYERRKGGNNIVFSSRLLESLWRRANARNVSFFTLYGG